MDTPRPTQAAMTDGTGNLRVAPETVSAGGRGHFEFTCTKPGTYRIEVVDERTLRRYRAEGRDGREDRAGGMILWIEPIVFFS